MYKYINYFSQVFKKIKFWFFWGGGKNSIRTNLLEYRGKEGGNEEGKWPTDKFFCK